MSKMRQPRRDDKTIIPPDGPETKTSPVDQGALITDVDVPPLQPTVDANPDEPGPAVAETIVSPLPSVDKTLEAPSQSVSETLEMRASDGAETADGGRTLDAGFSATDVIAGSSDDATAAAATTAPDPAFGLRSSSGRSIRPVVPGYEIIAEIGRGGMGVVYRPGTSGWIAWSRSR